jgi:seryl-tRNA synthetase
MIDLKLLRENPDFVKKALEKRNQKILFDEVLAWDEERRKLIVEMDALRERRNKTSQEVGTLKKQGKEPGEDIVAQMNSIREEIKEKERFQVSLDQKIEDFLLNIPNLPAKTQKTTGSSGIQARCRNRTLKQSLTGR